MKRKLVLAAALAGIALPAVGVVQANAQGNSPTSEAQMALAAPVKLDQAGQIALKAAPGTLAQIGFNNENGAGVFDASVIAADGTVTKVKVDAQSGKVLGTAQATTLGDGHEHGEQADQDQNGDGEEQDG